VGGFRGFRGVYGGDTPGRGVSQGVGPHPVLREDYMSL